MATIKTPVEGFSGQVVGVTFTDGVGETDNPAALAYFARQGYAISGAAKAPATGGSKPAGDGPSQAELKSRAKDLGVSASGSKADLAARIAEAEAKLKADADAAAAAEAAAKLAQAQADADEAAKLAAAENAGGEPVADPAAGSSVRTV